MAMMFASLAKTPLAALSRPCCGVIGKTIVVTLPGSVKGALENFHAILDVLQHAVDLASGSSGESFHSKMNDINSSQLPSSTPVHHHHHHRHSCGKAHHEHKPHSGKSDGIGVPGKEMSAAFFPSTQTNPPTS